MRHGSAGHWGRRNVSCDTCEPGGHRHAANHDGSYVAARNQGDDLIGPGYASTKGGIASYSFRVGDCRDPLAPSRLTLVGHGDRPTFVNTSLHLFNGFDYLFDADKGVVGYRWNGRLSAR